jgi:hypothetical protein
MIRSPTIGDASATYARYKYLGARRIDTEGNMMAGVKFAYARNSVRAFDRFGRVADQFWANYDPATLDRYTYQYDRAGNVASKTNVLNSALSESYTHDSLDRLTEWKVNGVSQATWSLDSLGNNLAAGTYNAGNEETP